MIKIISLTGCKQSGKTTAFNTIKENFKNVEEIMLARKIKEVCAEVFGFDLASFEDGKIKEKELETPIYLSKYLIEKVLDFYSDFFYSNNIVVDYNIHIRKHIGVMLYTRRQILQYIGTELLRSIDKDIHCKSAVLGLKEGILYVVTDLRFVSEFDFFNNLQNIKYYPFYIQNTKAELIACKDLHESEKQVFEVRKRCKMIENNDSMMNFQLRVVKEVREVLGEL